MDATMIPKSVLIVLAILLMGVAGYVALNTWLIKSKSRRADIRMPDYVIRNITVIDGKGWVPHPEDNLETED